MRHIYSDEEVLVLAYDLARIRKSFCHKILDTCKNEKILGDVDYVPPVQWKDYIESIDETRDISLHLNFLQKLEIKKHRLHS